MTTKTRKPKGGVTTLPPLTIEGAVEAVKLLERLGELGYAPREAVWKADEAPA
jgi:hypothetical protein